MGAMGPTDEAELAERLVDGDRRALARALSRVEDGSEAVLAHLIARLHPRTGNAALVGITGSPGVGKSTLTSALVAVWRARGRSVAVLAIDPSSPFSGGALLGDRVRMGDHALDSGVFIRSMASRGHLGGLSWATPQALLVLDAAGFDVVILETVGVGQAEVEVAGVADTTVVTMAPGMGDAVQAAKAGILEVADVFAVNKADRDGADRAVRELQEMQKLGHGAWLAPILRTVAAQSKGVDELVDAITEHREWLVREGVLRERRLARARLQIREIALATLRARMGEVDEGGDLDQVADLVAQRQIDPYEGAARLVAIVER
jgi:LAO/AO transport system kinase